MVNLVTCLLYVCYILLCFLLQSAASPHKHFCGRTRPLGGTPQEYPGAIALALSEL